VKRLRRAAGEAAGQASLFDAWNDQLSDAIDLASTHAVRLALDAFGRALDEVTEPKARVIVERLLRLFALQEIAKFSTMMIAEGLLSSELAGAIQPERTRLAGELYADVDVIRDAFRIPTSLLGTPIGEDYLTTHDFMKAEPAVFESYVRGLGAVESSAAHESEPVGEVG
jgi:acyl-CoA oxidase